MDQNVNPARVDGLSRVEVRKLFLTVVAFADQCREVFGDGVRLVYAKENGYEIGKRSEVDPERVVKLSDMCLDSSSFSEVDDGGSNRAK